MSTARKDSDAYQHASGGWGSVKAVAGALIHEKASVETSRVLLHQNKPDGFMCVGCSWAKPAHPHPFEFCESGAKATAWDTTSRRVDPDFFQQHTLAELERWHDQELENAGRLCAPMRWDTALDQYVEVSVGTGFRRDRPRTACDETRRSRVLHLRPRFARNGLHVPAFRANVRHQQSARQLEHVSRKHQRRLSRRRSAWASARSRWTISGIPI